MLAIRLDVWLWARWQELRTTARQFCSTQTSWRRDTEGIMPNPAVAGLQS